MVTRQDVLASENETFMYDVLGRLTSVSGPYSMSYAYDEIGNMVERGSDGQDIVWDCENRPVKITENSTVIAEFIYDGDGNRIAKTEGGETILYINSYYEENLTTGNITTSYYIGSRLIAQKEGTELRYMHQDHLSGTSVVTSDNGTLISSIKYYPFGGTRSGDVPTDVKFTGQRYDEGTGLYYYGARYYDPVTGRFISADTIIPNPADPQCYNRYSYCINNPLKYIDPSGHWGEKLTIDGEDYTLDPRTGQVTKINEMTQQQPSISDGSKPDMPKKSNNKLTTTKGFGFNISGGVVQGGSASGLVVWDDEGNIGFLVTAGEGEYAGCGGNIGFQTQFTNADTIYDLEGESLSGGGSGTLGVTSPATWFVVNLGQNTGVEYIQGPDYSGVNVQRGPGGSIFPVEAHTFDENSELIWSFNIKDMFRSIGDFFINLDWW